MSQHKRKLAAIVFTDIVGFTKLTAEDQTKASSLLTEQRNLLQPIVDSHNGTWIKEMGDGLLLIFDTVTDAVNCTIKIQEVTKEVEDLNLRIGIHQGEILLTDNDVIGDDVNIAARIEPFSAAGGIAISNKVNDALVRESGYDTKYVGKPKLKGVGQEVKVYCITSHDLPETKLSEVSAKLEKSKTVLYAGIAAAIFIPVMLYLFIFQEDDGVESIAILYMDVNSTSNENLSYLETITEDLIFDLSSSSQGLLNVSESSTVGKHKNSDLSIEELADKIGVDYVFKSSIKPDKNGYHLRCRLYDSYYQRDVFANKWFIDSKNLQSITGVLVDNIVKELDIDVLDGFERVEYNPEAYELYLRSKSLYALSDNHEDNVKAINLMKNAVSKDDNIVMATLYLGQMLYEIDENEKASIYFDRALSKSKSLQNNAGIAEALRKQGQLLRKQRDYEGAINRFSEALSISTVMNDKMSMAKTLNSMAILHYRMQDKDNALKNWLQALTLVEEFDDKLKMSKYLNNLGIWYFNDNDYSEAIEYYEKSLSIKEELKDVRNMGKTLNNLGEVYFDMGDYTISIEKFNESIKLKEKLNDKKGQVSSLFNRGKTFFFDQNYKNAINDFRMSATISNTDENTQKSNRFIGMSHFYLANHDSSVWYLEECYEYYSEDIRKQLSILPFLVISYNKVNDTKSSNRSLEEFEEIIEEEDPYPPDYIMTNWVAYEAFKSINQNAEAKGYLEDAYIEIKTQSKNIKNKKDRNKFLKMKFHQNIISKWSDT
jgi:class 3 adenylate cyclase/tetratricopeptide (TPR) repeat protein/TolB-like protein